MTTTTKSSHNLNWLSVAEATKNINDWPEWKKKYKLATPPQAKPRKTSVSTLTVKTSEIF